MSEAVFALAGALVGVLGTVLTSYVSARHEERRAWQESLGTVCVGLASQVSYLRDLSFQLQKNPDNAELQREAEKAHSWARGMQERLRLTSKSIKTQEAGRQLIHNVYYLWRSTQGGKGDFWEARRALDLWMTKFYAEARVELGLGRQEIYEDPPGGFPIPGGAGQPTETPREGT